MSDSNTGVGSFQRRSSMVKYLRRTATIAVLLSLATAGIALAQASGKGALYGTVKDNDGTNLPGVTVTLTGPSSSVIAITDVNGKFRFVQLDSGNYQLKTELDGFSPVEYPEIEIVLNRNTTIVITMSTAVEEVITVTTETPLLDERKIQQTTTITRLDLDKIPTSRDPFEIVRQAPGVIVDRVNVGGNESGQQANFLGTGSFVDQNKFAIDGVDISDQSALGSSATYFGFEQFEELQLSTGGTDIAVMTPGVQINLITKRGTNEWRGSATHLRTDGDWQSDPSLSLGEFPQGQLDQVTDPDTGQVDPNRFTGNQIELIRTWGIEAGGAALRDKLFFWAAFDFQNIDQNVFGGSSDDTDLENLVGKINAQVVPENSFEVSWNQGDKRKAGRGAAPNVEPGAAWNQAGPSPAWKAETTHVFNSSFFVTAHWSRVTGGFSLEPLGGRDLNEINDSEGNLTVTTRWLDTSRPTYRYQVNAASFFNTGEMAHELKYGVSTRRARNVSSSGWPGTGDLRGAQFYAGNQVGLPDELGYLVAWRDRVVANRADYDSAWIQDTFTKGRFTVNAGVRYDLQGGRNEASSAPAGALSAQGGLPALDFSGNEGAGFDQNNLTQELPGFEWETVSPRIGVTYALGEQRKTLLRANFSRFAEQLGTGTIERVNPLGFSASVFYFSDLNGNAFLDDAERDSLDFRFSFGGTTSVSSNVNDSNLDAPVIDELNIGVEHSFTPTLVGSASLILRNQSDILEFRELVRNTDTGEVRVATPADWEQFTTVSGSLPDGSTYNQPVYQLRSGLTSSGVGTLLVNGDRETDYQGLNFSLTKRLANRWMMRGNVSFNDWEWSVGQSFLAADDPTDELDINTNPAGGAAADNNGAQVAQTSAGSGPNDNYLSANWSFNLLGLYQVAPDRKWGFNLGANVSGREGFPVPFFAAQGGRAGGVGTVNVQATPALDSFRLDDVYTFDLRLDKDFSFRDFGLTVGVDAFNVFNDGTILGRENQIGSNRDNFVEQTLGPRIFRLQLKLSFK